MRLPVARVLALSALVAPMILLSPDAAPPWPVTTARAAPQLLGNLDFVGHVRMAGSGAGVAGARLRLWVQAGEYYPSWTKIAEVVTGAAGYFDLHVAIFAIPELTMPPEWFFRVEKINPAGHVSVSASPGACNIYCLEPAYADGLDNIRYKLWDYNGSYPNNLFYLAPAPPQVLSVSPNNGSGEAGILQSFKVIASDAGGAGDLRAIDLEIGTGCGFPFADTVHVSLQPLANQVFLRKDDGFSAFEGILPDAGLWGSGALENSQCVVRLNKTRYTKSGNQLTFEVGIRFKASYVGTYRLCARAKDSHGLEDGGDFGNWRVLPIATKTPTSTATRTATATLTNAPTPSATQTLAPGAPLYLPMLLKSG